MLVLPCTELRVIRKITTAKLSQVMYAEEKFKKINEAVKRKIFSLTDSSGKHRSCEGEMMSQLKENFHAELGPEISAVKVLDQHDKCTDSYNTDSS
jgi:hypothetical protein